MGRSIAAVTIVAAIGAWAACLDTAGLTGVSDPADADSGDPTDSANVPTDAAPTDAADSSRDDAGCPSGRGPNMVRIPVGTTTACIDATEVTQAQYAAFQTSDEPVAAHPDCAWNQGHYFSVETAAGSLPVASANWCQAEAFCRWAGKRLCGAVDGGALLKSEVADVERSVWFAACTRGGKRAVPYGTSYDPAACNGPERDAGGVVDAGSLPGCEGGYAGLFDMAGNAAEWLNSCDDAGASRDLDNCAVAGAAWYYGAQCSSGVALRNGYFQVGFRCCAP